MPSPPWPGSGPSGRRQPGLSLGGSSGGLSNPDEITTETVELALSARDMASEIVDQLGGRLNMLTASAARARESTGLLGAGVAAGVAAFFGVAVHSAMQFQDAMTQIQVNSNLTDAAIQQLGSTIDATAIGTTASANDMAAALAPVAGELQRVAGGSLTAQATTDALSAAQNLAASSGGQLTSSLKGITDLLLVYHENTSSAASVADNLFRAHTQLGISTDRLAMMLQRLQPRIAGSGVDMKTLLAIMTAMTPVVGTGARSIMQTGMVLQQLANPTAAAQKALQTLGVTLVDSSGKFVGFNSAIDQLHAAYMKLPSTVAGSAAATRLLADQHQLAADKAAVQTKGLRAQEAALKSQILTLQASGAALTQATFLQAIFGRSSEIGAALIQGGSAAIQGYVDQLNNQMTAQEAAIKMDNTLHGQLTLIAKAIETATTSIGMALVPGLQAINMHLIPVVKAITTWVTENPKLVATLLAVIGGIAGLVAGASVLDPIMGSIARTLTMLGGPTFLLIGGLMILARVVSGIPEVMGPLTDMFNQIGQAVGVIVPALEKVVGALGDLVAGRGSIEAVSSAVGNLGGILSSVIPALLTSLADIGRKLVAWAVGMIPQWIAALTRWAMAFVQWVGPMLVNLVDALGRGVSGIIAWLLNQVPVIIRTMMTWASAFIDWIGPLIVATINQLGIWINSIVAWLVKNVGLITDTLLGWIVTMIPTLMTDLGAWSQAFISWVSPAANGILNALGTLLNDLIDWLLRAIPILANALGGWVTAFIDWISFRAIPGLIDEAGRLIDQFSAWISRSDTIGRITDALVSWTTAFVLWSVPVAATLIGSIISNLAKLIVTRGPELAIALIAGGVRIVEGLARGLIDHPDAIVAAIITVFTGSAIMRAIGLAGAAAGNVYALSLKIGDAIGETVSAAWEGVSTAATELAGATAGVAYDAAMELLRLISDGLSAVWSAVAEDLGITAAAGGAGSIAGTAYAAAENFATALKAALIRVWAMIAGSPEVGGAAAAAGAVQGSEMAAGTAAPGVVKGIFGEKIVISGAAEAAGGGAVAAEGGQIGGGLIAAIGDALKGGAALLGGAVVSLLSGIGELFLGALGSFGEALAVGIGGAFTGAMAVVGGIVVAAIAGIALAILNPRTVGQIIGALAGLVADVIGGIGSLLGQLLNIGSQIVGTIIDGIGNAVSEAAGAVMDAIGGLFNLIGQALQDPGGTLSAAAGHILSFFHDLPGQLADAFGGAWNTVTGAIGGAISGVANAVGGWFGQVAQGIGEGFNAVTPQAQSAGAQVGAAVEAGVQSKLSHMPTDAQTATAGVAAAVAGGAASMYAASDTMWTGAENAQRQDTTKMIADAAKLADQMANALTSQQSAIDAAINGIMGTIDAGIVKKTPALAAAMATVAELMKKPILTLNERDALLKGELVIANYQLGAAQKAGDPIAISKAEATVDDIRKQMNDLAAAAESYGKETMAQYVQGLTAADVAGIKIPLGKLKGLLMTMSPPPVDNPLHDIGTWGANTMQQWVEGMVQAGNAGVGAVRNVMNGMRNAIQSGMSTIHVVFVNTAASIAASAYEWGYNLVRNYADGIRSALPVVTSAVTVMTSKIAAMTKLASPAEEGPLSENGGPEGWGARFDQLYAAGLAGGAVARAAQAMAATLASPVRTLALTGGGTAVAALARSGGASGLATAGNTTVKVYLDGSEVKGVISRLLFEEERQYGGPAVAGSPF